jgi:hypothetical protein
VTAIVYYDVVEILTHKVGDLDQHFARKIRFIIKVQYPFRLAIGKDTGATDDLFEFLCGIGKTRIIQLTMIVVDTRSEDHDA